MKDRHRSILLWSSTILGIIALLWGLSHISTSPNHAETPVADLSQAAEAHDHKKGPDTADYVIIEYSDFQCPACAVQAPALDRLQNQFPDAVQIVYRHYPLTAIHKHAMLAAQATEAAAFQGKFWDMHDVLFNTQKQWSNIDDPVDYFTKLAKSIGLDTEKFSQDITSSVAKDRVKKHIKEAENMKLRGTPSFFLNGKEIRFNTYEELSSLVTENK